MKGHARIGPWFALVSVAALAAATAVGCENSASGAAPASGLEAIALRPIVAPVLREAATRTPAAVRVLRQALREGGDAADRAIGLRWTFTPKTLQVYRSTTVHMVLDQAPSGHATASCSWNFGDGSPIAAGCSVSHTFHGGQADQRVQLTLQDGDWRWTSTRTVPLERLSVVHDVPGVGDEGNSVPDRLPARPVKGPRSLRFALIADSAAEGGVPADVSQAVRALADIVKPELVIDVGGAVPPHPDANDWRRVRQAIIAPLADAGIPIVFATSPDEVGEATRYLPKPRLTMLDARAYPDHYTFAIHGALFLVFAATRDGDVREPTLRWMRGALAKASVYDARYVVSYLPLHKYTDQHLGSLAKTFRLYELFLRGRVTVFFSAGYRVYFKGRYGALSVVSVGALAGEGNTLAGTKVRQPPSLVVVDHVKGVPERTFAVVGPRFDRIESDAILPNAIEVYTR